MTFSSSQNDRNQVFIIFHDKFISTRKFFILITFRQSHPTRNEQRAQSDEDNNKAIKLITNGNIFKFLYDIFLSLAHQLIESDLSELSFAFFCS